MNLNLTLIAQMATFAVFVWFCKKYIWTFVIDAMRERQNTIAAGLEAAERAEKDLALAQEAATGRVRESKEEAQKIIEQARARANQMIEEAKAEARSEGERVKDAARAEIDLEVNRAKEVLRGQLATLAVSGAEKVLGSAIDRSKHAELLDRLTAEL